MLLFFVIHRSKFVKYSLTCIYKESSAKYLSKYLIFSYNQCFRRHSTIFLFLICEGWCLLAAIYEKALSAIYSLRKM